VQQYWDPNHLLATQMKKDARAPQPVQDCCTRSGILWDLAAVYPAGSTWSDRMPAATMFNGPFVDVTDAIKNALAPRGSGARRDYGSSPSPAPNTNRLVFLTRGGCANTAVMRRNLDDALKSFAFTYEVLDQDTLPAADVRRGYPTPTLLYEDRDVFGMSVPSPPLPDPT
jgi:hypothetical protein